MIKLFLTEKKTIQEYPAEATKQGARQRLRLLESYFAAA
jgi:hypothetical protein